MSSCHLRRTSDSGSSLPSLPESVIMAIFDLLLAKIVRPVPLNKLLHVFQSTPFSSVPYPSNLFTFRAMAVVITRRWTSCRELSSRKPTGIIHPVVHVFSSFIYFRLRDAFFNLLPTGNLLPSDVYFGKHRNCLTFEKALC